jgi:hypothetical protein
MLREISFIFKVLEIEVEVEITIRLTISQSVCLGVDPTLGLVIRHYFLSEGCGPVSVGRPL